MIKIFTIEKGISLLRDPWTKCEELLNSVVMQAENKSMERLGKSKWIELCDFLRDIEFISIINDINYDVELTETGKEYHKSKFILKDEKRTTSILTDALKKFPPTQAICQLFWGRPALGRESIYKLLVFEEYVIPISFKQEDLGSYLMLLNRCKIIKYSKKKNSIIILYNPRTGEGPKPETSFLSPETPYSNVRNLWEILRSCTSFVHWVDKHFSAKGLEPLADEADGTRVKEIKILTGITSRGVNKKLRRDFIRFRQEMETRKIKSQLRVICDKQLLSDIHDRWIVSKNICFNIPPVDTIFKGQYSEMKKTSNRPLFGEWWGKGLDIVEDWIDISKNIEDTR